MKCDFIDTVHLQCRWRRHVVRLMSITAAVAELRQAAELIPNQWVLIGTLPLLEAGASSEIENIVTTAGRLFQQVNDEEHADAATLTGHRHRVSPAWPPGSTEMRANT